MTRSCGMDYPVQWDIIVDILVVLIGLLQDDEWHKALTIILGKGKECAPSWCLLSSLNFSHSFTLKTIVSIYDLVPSSVEIKPKFIAVPFLSGSWLDIIHIRRYDIFFNNS